MFTCDAIIEHSTVLKLQTKEGCVNGSPPFHTSVLRSTLKFNAKPKGYCFVDFQKAFDTVSREALLYKLSLLGIGGRLFDCLANM